MAETAPTSRAATSAFRAALVGAAVGLLVGTLDTVLSGSAIGQFAPGLGAKARTAGYVAFLYGAAGAFVAPVFALASGLLWNHTQLGALGRFAWRQHHTTRETHPVDAVVGASLAAVGVPCVMGSWAAAYFAAMTSLGSRNHLPLVIASTIAIALVSTGAGVITAFVLARPVEFTMRRARGRALAVLSHPLSAAVIAALWVTLLGAAALAASWSTIKLLPLRAPTVVLVWMAIAIAGTVLMARRGWGGDRRPAVLGAAPLALAAVCVLAAVGLGASSGARKAAASYTGLTQPLSAVLRLAFDFDRDGYSSILGGGDCDDFSSAVHPGASDIPGDGIDQNCVAGDPPVHGRSENTRFAPRAPAIPDDVNVVLITIDTLRADNVGAYGYSRPTTPNIDALGADGAVFENAWAHAPSTRYSIPALLTGRYPLSVNYDTSVSGWPGLSPDNTTIAEVMKSRGYTTGAILNYWYFQKQRHMDQGFDSYDNQNARLHRGIKGEGPAKTRGSSSKEQTDKAIEFAREHSGDRFFLWVHYYDPHFEYESHRGTPNFGDAPMDRYDQEVRFTDHHIGRFIKELKTLGLYDKTAFVVTGDHGEGFGEHGIDLHGYHLYRAQTKVPLIVRVPGVSPTRPRMPAGHVDVLPTLANLVGAPATSEMMGTSLLGPIQGVDGSPDRMVFQQLSYENNNEMRAGASANCHVVYNVSPQTSWELYDLNADPNETVDIVDSPGACKGAVTELERWYDASLVPPGAADALVTDRPTPTKPAMVSIGDVATLIGIDVIGTPKRGDIAELELSFEAGEPLGDDWRVFLHMESKTGSRFTADHSPARPFSWWKDGQFIRYRQSFSIPTNGRPGEYTVWFGVFRGDRRLPLSSSTVQVTDDRAAVARFRL